MNHTLMDHGSQMIHNRKMTEPLVQALSHIMADTYAIYLKTQNYHWHVRGPNFRSLHVFLEEQYMQLAKAIDAIAERIVTLGGTAPADFQSLLSFTHIKKGNSDHLSHEMLMDLCADHDQIIQNLRQALLLAHQAEDEGSSNLLSERIAVHEKMHWMLRVSIEA